MVTISVYRVECFRWISEKMDGFRAYWNGEKLLSRGGNELPCPKWFVDGLPLGTKLDGEIWMGRGTLDILKGILRSSLDNSKMWKNITFSVFDLVDFNLCYEDRMATLANLDLPSFACVVEMERCRENDHLQEVLQTIVSKNGEGLVLTKPNSLYVSTRTNSRLKVKVCVKYLG